MLSDGIGLIQISMRTNGFLEITSYIKVISTKKLTGTSCMVHQNHIATVFTYCIYIYIYLLFLCHLFMLLIIYHVTKCTLYYKSRLELVVINFIRIPSYDELVCDHHDDEDEDEVEKQEEFERKYNFRFEEPGAATVIIACFVETAR